MNSEQAIPESVDTVQGNDDVTPTSPEPPPREIGGRKAGPDPTRYGDWEKNGRCIDF
jgi:hypothetical protein